MWSGSRRMSSDPERLCFRLSSTIPSCSGPEMLWMVSSLSIPTYSGPARKPRRRQEPSRAGPSSRFCSLLCPSLVKKRVPSQEHAPREPKRRYNKLPGAGIRAGEFFTRRRANSARIMVHAVLRYRTRYGITALLCGDSAFQSTSSAGTKVSSKNRCDYARGAHRQLTAATRKVLKVRLFRPTVHLRIVAAE